MTEMKTASVAAAGFPLTLILTGAALIFSLSATPGKAAETVRFEEIGLSLHPLGDGIWRHVSTTVMESGRPVPANGLIVTSGAEALVIDTGWSAEQTGAILDWIENDLRFAPIGIVVTHFHYDCMGGIDVALDRGLKTWGHSRTTSLANDYGLSAPVSLFDDRLTVMVGKRPVELYYPGAGHAPDNIVASIPDRRLLFGGCLVKSAAAESLGFRGDADLVLWPGSIEAVRARFPAVMLVVPGHGEPGTAELYMNTLRLLQEARP
jgi:metallo-beta-lactamase class B